MVSSLAQAISTYGTIALANGLSPRTVEWVSLSARLLLRFLGEDTALEAITPQDVRRWVMAMRQRPAWADRPDIKAKRPLSPTSINNYVRGVKLLLSTLAREGLIDPHPVARMPAPKPGKMAIRPFTPGELKRIFKALGETEHPLRDRAVVGLLFDPSLRLSEAVGIKTADMDLSQRRAVVLGKGAKQRLVPLSAWTAKMVLLYQARERPRVDSPWTFLEDDGTPLTAHAVQQVLRRVSRSLGLRVHAHRFRHSGATEYLKGGGDSLYLQALLGHSSLAMTQRYVKIAGLDLQEAHRRHSPGDRLRL